MDKLASMTSRKADRLRGLGFGGLWLLTTAGLGWQLTQQPLGFDQPATGPALLALLGCTVALLWWLPGPQLAAEHQGALRTRRGWFVLVVVGTVVGLVTLRLVAGPRLLFGLPVVSGIILAVLRPPLGRRALLYGAGLALVAGGAGLGTRWVPFPPWCGRVCRWPWWGRGCWPAGLSSLPPGC